MPAKNQSRVTAWSLRAQRPPAIPLHTGMMEKTFPHIPFERHGNAGVTMQIAKPFAVLGIGEMLVRPIMNQFVPARVFSIARQFVGEQRGDNGLIMWPPKLHV